MMRKSILATTILLLASGFPALAQGNIPAEVIAECNEAGRASDLPDCLKNGAIAFEMLALARDAGFYGDAAEPVISACAGRNESFKTTWLCFETAAEKAAETKSLIGIENIADACVAAISDGETHAEIDRIYREKRDARFPNEMFFGGDMFYPFQGCSSGAEDTSQEGAAAPSTGAQPAEAATMSAARCDALGELETAISSHSADELKEIQASLKNEDEAGAIADLLDISPAAATELMNGNDAQKMQMAMLLGAFLREHHPPLFQAILEDPSQIQEGPGAELGGQMATGLITMMIEGAEEKYRTGCAPS